MAGSLVNARTIFLAFFHVCPSLTLQKSMFRSLKRIYDSFWYSLTIFRAVRASFAKCQNKIEGVIFRWLLQ